MKLQKSRIKSDYERKEIIQAIEEGKAFWVETHSGGDDDLYIASSSDEAIEEYRACCNTPADIDVFCSAVDSLDESFVHNTEFFCEEEFECGSLEDFILEIEQMDIQPPDLVEIEGSKIVAQFFHNGENYRYTVGEVR